MKYAVMGTGEVGQQIATKLVALGHEVRLGSRSPSHASAVAWAGASGERAGYGTFDEVAAWGERVFLCVSGQGAVAALEAAAANLQGKLVLDLTNPLDFSQGFPPSLFVSNTDSLGERLQRAVPGARIVKTLNTLSNAIMVNPGRVGGGDHTIFVSGDDAGAKAEATALLGQEFGWRDIIDLGDITTARGAEAVLPLWVRLWGVLGTSDFQIKIVRGPQAS